MYAKIRVRPTEQAKSQVVREEDFFYVRLDENYSLANFQRMLRVNMGQVADLLTYEEVGRFENYDAALEDLGTYLNHADNIQVFWPPLRLNLAVIERSEKHDQTDVGSLH